MIAIKRLIDFYVRSMDGSLSTMTAIWRPIFDNYHSRLHDYLGNKNEAALRDYLGKVAPEKCLWGIDNHTTMAAETFKLRLTQIARKMGILPFENPEQPVAPPPVDSALLVSRVEDEAGLTLSFPECFGYGSTGVPSSLLKYVASFYTIKRALLGKAPDSIFEIGGGIGTLAHIGWKTGCKRYRVIDLPIVSVLSAYFVSSFCDEAKIWMWGEPENPDAWARYYPSTHYQMDDDETFEVAFNSDSFPEIPVANQDDYVRLFERKVSANGILVSINHESNNVGQRRINPVVRASSAFSLQFRAPWFLRPGYVEEVWRKVQ